MHSTLAWTCLDVVCFGLVGPCCRVPAAGYHVHQVHPDLPASGTGLRPDCSPAETARSSARSRRRDGQSP